jgi:hypothetical protein
MSRRNMCKALFLFFGVEENEMVSLHVLEKLASLATRYAIINPEMRPYVGQLYAPLAGQVRGRYSRGGLAVKVQLSEEAKHCIRRWRAVLCLQELEGTRVRRPISEMVPREALWLIEYDGSLTGLGIRIFELDSQGDETLKIAVGVNTPFGLRGEIWYQNTMEFWAIVAGLALVKREGVSGAWIRLRGDSTSSLSWATEESFKVGSSESTALALFGVSHRKRD